MKGERAAQPLGICVRGSSTRNPEPVVTADTTSHDQAAPEPRDPRVAQGNIVVPISSLYRDQDMQGRLLTPQPIETRLPAFQFIDEQDLHGPQNAELRRAVRAHVRRDITAKRQREHAVYKSRFSTNRRILKKKNSLASSSARNSTSSISPDGEISRDGNTSNPSSSRTDESVTRHPRSKKSFPVHIFRVAPVAGVNAAKKHPTTRPDIHPDNIQQMNIPMQSKYTPNTAATTPYALLMGPDAPVLYMQPQRWPFMHSIQGLRPATSVYLPTSAIPIPNIHSPRPCLLKNARINMWIVNSVDYFIFKDKLIKWVNDRLTDAQKGTDGTTVGGILLLTSLELCRGNSIELKAHMAGLEKIAVIRGGLSKMIGMNHFHLKVQLIDLLVAVMLDIEPRFPALGLDRPIRPSPRLHGLIQVPDSPLYGHQYLQDVLHGSPFCSQSIGLLQQMQSMTRAFLAGTTTTGAGTPSQLISFISTYFESSPSHIPDLNPHPSLLNLVAVTSTLYTTFFSPNALPLSVSILTTTLTTYLECTDHDETWMKYPGILLWIVLTGGTAIRGERGERSLFILWATRLGLTSAWGWWEEMRGSIEVFAKVRRGK